VWIAGDKDARVSRGAKAVAWLGRNSVEATVESDVAADVDVGELIVSRAADLDADLIVMGIYSHSCMHEMVLGDARKTLCASMTVPVFMVH
jgi:nucleotide-binding universal stress UspA family protein